MQYPIYDAMYASDDFLEFEFVSTGPKGNIIKVVQFIETNDPDIYNLVLSNSMQDGQLNDIDISDNKDRNKILATVAIIIFYFTEVKPHKCVLLMGNTGVRNRLYRMAISLNLRELNIYFEIYGLNWYGKELVKEKFDKQKDYEGFLIKRK